jgi:hypothetical protein
VSRDTVRPNLSSVFRLAVRAACSSRSALTTSPDLANLLEVMLAIPRGIPVATAISPAVSDRPRAPRGHSRASARGAPLPAAACSWLRSRSPVRTRPRRVAGTTKSPAPPAAIVAPPGAPRHPLLPPMIRRSPRLPESRGCERFARRASDDRSGRGPSARRRAIKARDAPASMKSDRKAPTARIHATEWRARMRPVDGRAAAPASPRARSLGANLSSLSARR